jgi:hypothetical protein
MNAIRRALALLGCVSIVAPLMAQATQPSIDDLQKQATYASTLAGTQKTLIDSNLSVLQAIGAAGSGSGGGGDYDKTAEAVLVGHYALAGAAQKLATYLHSYKLSDQPILLVVGAPPPAIGNFIEFERSRELIDHVLNAANSDWAIAEKTPTPTAVRVTVKGKPKPARGVIVTPCGKKGGCPMAVGPAAASPDTQVITGLAATGNPVGLALAAAATLASLGRVDSTVNGASVPTDAEQEKAIVTAALEAAGFTVDLSDYDMATDPSDQDLGLVKFRRDYDLAYTNYHRAYMTRLSKAGGKTDSLPANVAAAGANLTAALQAADSFYTNLIKANGGVSPLSTIYAQELLANQRATHQILYLRSVHTGVTVRSNKGFFVGITRSPSDFEGVASIDYLVATPSTRHDGNGIYGFAASPNAAVYYTGLIHLWRVPDFIRDNTLANPPPVLPCLGTGPRKSPHALPQGCVAPPPLPDAHAAVAG